MAVSLLASGAADQDDFLTFGPDELELIHLSTGEEDQAGVRRGDIPGLLDDQFVRAALKEWSRYKRFGLANGHGWRGERALYVRTIEVCEQEYSFVTTRMRETDTDGGE